MLGSDLPIERLRSGFEPLYGAYDEIFAGYAERDRHLLLAGSRDAVVRGRLKSARGLAQRSYSEA